MFSVVELKPGLVAVVTVANNVLLLASVYYVCDSNIHLLEDFCGLHKHILIPLTCFRQYPLQNAVFLTSRIFCRQKKFITVLIYSHVKT